MSSRSTTMRLEGGLCVQRGTPMLQTFSNALQVTRQAEVDVYDPTTREGYQRSPVTARMRAAATYYGEKNGRMPNPLLLNVRADDFDEVTVTVTGGDLAEYERAAAEGGDWIGTGNIEFSDDLNLWLYDGQHRNGGLRELLTRDPEFVTFPVPISITLGLSTEDEMTEFYEVNTNAKAVKTDLAWELLSRMAEDNEDLRDLLAAADRDWIVRGIEVMRELEKLSGPWTTRILPPNTRRPRGSDYTIPEAQFVRSLKPVLDMPVLKRADSAKIAALLDAYWRGIEKVMPEPFARPNEYVVQKGQGTVAFHRVLPQVVEVIRARGGRLGDPGAYSDVLRDLPTLSGEFVQADGSVVTREGEDFWQVGSVASGFSGDSGRRRLGLLIQTLLPKPSDEIEL